MVKYHLHGTRGDNKISNGAAAQGAAGMGFWKTVLGIARRPFIGLPVLGFALIFGASAYLAAPTHYISSGYMVLTTPTSGGAIDPTKSTFTTNPLLAFNDGLKTTAAILIQSVNTDTVMGQLGAGSGSGTKITVNDGSSNSQLANSSSTGPFIFVQVDSTSPVGVRDAVLRAENHIRDDLTNRERTLNAPKTTYLLLTDVVTPANPVAKNTTKYEYAAGAGLGTILLGFGIALAVQRIRGAGARRTPATAPTGSPRNGSGGGRGPERGDRLVSSGPVPNSPRTSLADHYWLGGGVADRADHNRLDQGWTTEPARPRRIETPEPVVEQDETREFPMVFDDEGDLEPTGPNPIVGRGSVVEAAAKGSDDDHEPRRRPLKILRARPEDDQDDAAPRAG
jgi:hypothetical protein